MALRRWFRAVACTCAFPDLNRKNDRDLGQRSTSRSPIWRREVPRELESQRSAVTGARSRLERRPPATLTQEVAILDRGTFRNDGPEASAVWGAVQTFVADLCRAVGELDSLFTSLRVTVRLVGSFGDGTRVSAKPDEFDLLVVVTWEGMTVRKEKQWWCVYSAGLDGVKVGAGEVFQRWRQAVDARMATVHLPEGLTHDGPLSPQYTGLKGNSGTAVTLRLLWMGVTPVTVDLTPSVPVPRAALLGRTQDRIARVEAMAGLDHSPHPAHLVPEVMDGTDSWKVTTCVLESRVLSKLGPGSPTVSIIRGLKLQVRHYLQWRPLNESAVEHANDVIRALATGERMGPGSEQAAPIDGFVDVEGLSDCVKASVDTGRLQLPQPREGEEEGTGAGVYVSRVALVVVATHRAHSEQRRGQRPSPCGLCAELRHYARWLMGDDAGRLLHPAVAKVVGIPASPQIEISSAYLKYLVLGDFVDGAMGAGSHVLGSADPVRPYMGRLVQQMEVIGRIGVPHPILDGDIVEHIFPVVQRGASLDTSGAAQGRTGLSQKLKFVTEADGTLSLRMHHVKYPIWVLTPYSIPGCHQEVCRQLYDVSLFT